LYISTIFANKFVDVKCVKLNIFVCSVQYKFKKRFFLTSKNEVEISYKFYILMAFEFGLVSVKSDYWQLYIY